MHYYSFHIADFALHTSHLNLEEEAVFRRLLDYYYDTESPIPKKTESVIRRLRLGSYEKTVALILAEFFVLQDDGWHNLRADIEISEYHLKAEKARENGKKGGRPKKNKGVETKVVNLANPEITGSKANQEPITINQEPITINKHRRGSRLPENWEITSEHVAEALAINQTMTSQQIMDCGDRFRDYWVSKSGKDAVKTDWIATWRNWIRNQNSFGKQKVLVSNGTRERTLAQDLSDTTWAK